MSDNNCMQRCLAHALNRPIKTVPHFWEEAQGDGQLFEELVRAFLEARNHSLLVLVVDFSSLEDCLNLMEQVPLHHWVLVGYRQNCNHAVLYKGDRLILDPAYPAKTMTPGHLTDGSKAWGIWLIL